MMAMRSKHPKMNSKTMDHQQTINSKTQEITTINTIIGINKFTLCVRCGAVHSKQYQQYSTFYNRINMVYEYMQSEVYTFYVDN